MEGTAAGTIPLNIWTFYFVAFFLSVLNAAMEVAAAFRDKQHGIRHTVFHPWSWLLYGWYCGLTLLVGQVLFEQGVLKLSWVGAIALGLLGPALFRTHVKLFQPISGKQGPSANLEKLIAGIQSFCFEQINRSLSRARIHQKENLLKVDEAALLQRLQLVSTNDEYQKATALIEERSQADPKSVRPLILELIENKDPLALTVPFGEKAPPLTEDKAKKQGGKP